MGILLSLSCMKVMTKDDKYEELYLTAALDAGAETHLPVSSECADGDGKSCDDTRKQEHGDTVSDAVLVDLLTEPHHQRGARGEHEHDNDAREYHREALVVNGDVLAVVVALYLADGVLEVEEVGGALNQTERYGDVTRDGADFASARLTFLGETLERGDGYAEKLDNNRAVDVGGDTHCEEGRVGERAARKGVQVGDHVRAAAGEIVGVRHNRAENVVIEERNGDDRTDSEYNNNQKGEQNLLPKVRDGPSVFNGF